MEEQFYENAEIEDGVLLKYEGKDTDSIVIPEGVTAIGGGRIEACKHLTSVTIPASVTAIDDWEDYEREKPTIFAPPDSFAWQWAQQNAFPVKESVPKRKAGICPHCGGKLKGLIFKKCVSCGKH